MSMSILEKLDRQIDALLQHHERQKLENRLLREKQAQLLAEKKDLLKKHEAATNGIKKLIEKLKRLEHSYDSSRTS